MASARGLANHSLYMARILASQWQTRLAEQPSESLALNAAFAPALQLHLLNAYGWFLLASVRLTTLPERPPHSTADLPPLGQGIVAPAEVDECRHLERDGWLLLLQTPIPNGLPTKNDTTILARSGTYPMLDDFNAWISALDQLFARMSSSLDEN